MDPCCGNCRCFRRSAPLQEQGVCRANPPTLVFTGFTPQGQPRTGCFWPIVPDTEWCAAHEPAVPARARPIDLEAEAHEGTA